MEVLQLEKEITSVNQDHAAFLDHSNIVRTTGYIEKSHRHFAILWEVLAQLLYSTVEPLSMQRQAFPGFLCSYDNYYLELCTGQRYALSAYEDTRTTSIISPGNVSTKVYGNLRPHT